MPAVGQVGVGVAYFRDVLEPYVVADVYLSDVLDALEIADRSHGEAALAVRDLAGRYHEIAAAECLDEPVYVYTVFDYTVGGELDPDLLALDAVELHLRDPLDAFDTPLQVALEHVVRVGEIAVARDAEDHHLHIRCREFPYEETLEVGGEEVPDAVYLLLRFERLDIGVDAPVELDANP